MRVFFLAAATLLLTGATTAQPPPNEYYSVIRELYGIAAATPNDMPAQEMVDMYCLMVADEKQEECLKEGHEIVVRTLKVGTLLSEAEEAARLGRIIREKKFLSDAAAEALTLKLVSQRWSNTYMMPPAGDTTPEEKRI